MGRGYCVCSHRQRADGSCGNAACNKYRPGVTGCHLNTKAKAKAKTKGSPFLARELRRRLTRKSKASSTGNQAAQEALPEADEAAQEPALEAVEAAAQEGAQEAVEAAQEGAQEPPEAVEAAPQTPTTAKLSGRQKNRIIQFLWEQLDAIRGLLGPDMACHVVGSAIRAVELISQELPKIPDSKLAESFLNVGAALAGGQLQTELNSVRDLHPGSMDIEHDIMQAMQPFKFWCSQTIEPYRL